MDFSISSLPVELPSSPAPAKKRHRRTKWKSGRLYLFLLFLWLRLVDVFILTCVYPKLPITQKPAVLGWILITAIWTTVLLTVIWCRQRWGNYILSGSLLVAVVATLSGIPGLPDVPHPKRDLLFIVEFTIAYLPVALVLMSSAKINKLTAQTLKVSGDKDQDWPK